MIPCLCPVAWGTPSPLLDDKLISFQHFGDNGCPQSIHNKWVIGKIFFLNELAPEVIRGLLVFDLYKV
jgi:hypothetical protein